MVCSLFEKIDTDGDNQISQQKLKELVMGIKFGKIPTDVDHAVVKIMEELDTSGDHMISQEEFVVGFVKWLNTFHNQEESQDGTYQVSILTKLSIYPTFLTFCIATLKHTTYLGC